MTFHKMKPSELKPFASVPQCLDNQWAPNTAIQVMHKTGRSRVDMEEALKPAVRRGFMRALLQSDQVIVNRAYFHNCRTISDMYMDTDERESLGELLSEAAIIPYFMAETDPLEPVVFETDDRKERWEAWKDLCSSSDLSCLRLSWNDKVNAKKTRDLLARRYQDFIVSLEHGDPKLFCRDFGLDDSAQSSKTFRNKLEDITDEATNALRRKRRLTEDSEDEFSSSCFVTRAELYKKFVCPDDAPVTDGYIDNSKPFSAQIKQLIDLRYNINLPDALDRFTVTASDSIGRHVLQEVETFTRGAKPVDARELGRVIGDIAFNLGPQLYEPKELHNLHLADICALRGDPLFDKYIKSVERALPSSNVPLSECGLFKDPSNALNNLTNDYYDLIKEGGQRALVRAKRDPNWKPFSNLVIHFVGTGISSIYDLDSYTLQVPQISEIILNSGPVGIIVELALGAVAKKGAARMIANEHNLRIPLLKAKVDDAGEALLALQAGILQEKRTVQIIEFNPRTQVPVRLGGYEPRDIEIDNP